LLRALDAQWAVHQQLQLIAAHLALHADADAVTGGHVVAAGGQARAVFTVAKHHRGLLTVVVACAVDACVAGLAVQRGHLGPGDAVDTNLQRAFTATGGGGLGVGEWRLGEGETLHGDAAVATADGFTARTAGELGDNLGAGLAVGGGHHVGMDAQALPLIGMF